MGLVTMMNRALTILPALLLAAAATATIAHADEQQGQPVVVISPQAPVIVTTGGGAGPSTVATPAAASVAVNGAPQNEDWSNVSHINGQLVKVGETNDYKKAFKRTNISTNPIGFIYGSYGVSASYGLNDHVAIRGDLNYLSGYLDEDTSGVEIGVGAPIYFRRTYQGAFLEPGFISRRFTHTYSCDFECASNSATTETVSTFGPQMLVGWHWTWDSGLNIAVAGGVGRNWASADSYDKIFPNGYLRFGYAF